MLDKSPHELLNHLPTPATIIPRPAVMASPSATKAQATKIGNAPIYSTKPLKSNIA
jgi:hypothetical protein